MIRLGICTAAENLDKIAAIGFDYIELGLSRTAALSDAEFSELEAMVSASPLKAECFNGMLPAEVRVTGDNVNATAQHEYLDHAFSRARRLGGRVVVFGSSAARNVPYGFPIDMAWRQIANFLRLVERHAAAYDITVAIEPLRRAECNVINYVSEAVMLASLFQLPHIKALGDTYHMAVGSESLKALTLAGSMLAHVHTANGLDRRCPSFGDGEDYTGIFKALLLGGYDGRVSIEGRFDDLEHEAREGLEVLTKAREAAMNEIASGK